MLLPYEPWHLNIAGEFVEPVHADVLERLGGAKLAYTIVATRGNETVILGVAGAAPMKGREDVVEVFVSPTTARDQHPRVFAWSVKRILGYCREHFGRIEAACPENCERRCRFLEWLGFKPYAQVEGGKLRWAMEGA